VAAVVPRRQVLQQIVCGKDFWHIAKEARWWDFSLSVFRPTELATHLLQVADELATKTGVPGAPPSFEDRLEPATAVLQVAGCQVP
jgi:hypothetical protein